MLRFHCYLGGAISPKEIKPPSIQIFASFVDKDNNKVLSKDEEGNVEISLSNVGDEEAKDVVVETSILEKEFNNRISYQSVIGVGNLRGGETRKINIPIKAKEELPKSSFTFQILCSYKGGSKKEEIKINTAPTIGMIKVAFKNLSAEDLPSWIIPTSKEYADYLVEYLEDKIQILNLNTGERKITKVSSLKEAKDFVKDFFLRWDREAPKIIVSTTGGIINTEKVRMKIRFSDDRKINETKIYLNDKIFKTENFAELTETEREIEFPLEMGDNKIRILLSDWVDKRDEKVIAFTRIRGGEGVYVVGELPKAEPPPSLILSVSSLDGNNTIVGGKEEGIKISITNKGRGIAKWVRVLLEGDEFLISQWGRERNLEDIKPNETKTAIFSLLMPTELPKREAKIEIVVKEGRGYSPTERPIFTFNLIPAEVVRKEEEIIEDVDYDIPEGKMRRRKGYALIIGFSKYLNLSAPKYAKNDAEIFSRYISKVFGIDNLEFLYDEKATCATIKGKISDWLKNKTGFKVIYFAGHGVPDPKNPKEGDVHLLPYDGNPELKSTLIGLEEIIQLSANPNDTILIFLDACFSGGEGRTVQLAGRPIVAPEIKRIEKPNTFIFAAAEGNQPAKEFEKARHGYFTYYTLLGLKGKADINRDGWLTTTELYNFVKENVADKTNNLQIPVLRPEKEIRIVKIR
ncbi:MAG: caspase family protein [candidate division WOR-3 bacterium]|nr:caspase family protein [candidate division WOR-3 bacterium]